ncbi:NAD(P)-dependent oxidoreductase [Furfurilactobacillus curtus]|uniref:3-hydroxyisobutyrate dehydrogenase n=1 Tax=Furfurilactobacillus curtus TaxID=1746200 RepID=A0ABQ5JLM5_9LACO
MNISFIGIGDMGSQMVPHLAEAGHTVTIWDRDPDKMAAIESDRIAVGSSLENVVKASQVIITSVMSDDVLALHLGNDHTPGIIKYLQPDSILIVTSTLDPEKIFTINQAMPTTTKLLDVPMIGGVRYAREAQLNLIAAGPTKAFEVVSPILSLLGNVKYTGALGNGAKLKLITNVGIMAAEAGIRETLDLADAYGIDYETVLDLLQVGPLKPVVIRALDQTNPRPLKDSVADVDELLAATESLLKLPLAEAARNRLRKAVNDDPQEARFIDITTTDTKLPQFRQ